MPDKSRTISQVDAYRLKVLAAHRPAFDLYGDVTDEIERALRAPRRRPELTDLALDMLVGQAHKSYVAVALLAQHGLEEDAATAARRLLELGVQAVYLGADSDASVRERRAIMYLSYVWRGLPRGVKRQLPPRLRDQWVRIARRCTRHLRANAKSWGPNFKEMFKAIGAERSYDSNYRLLSRIAHGSTENLVLQFARPHVQMFSYKFTSVLIAHASRYLLGAVQPWNARLGVIPESAFQALLSRACQLR